MPISFTATGPQQHLLAEAIDTPVDPMVTDTCVRPRCFSFPFTLAKPTKASKSVSVSAQITWSSPASRFWLYLRDLTKAETLAECFSFYGSAGPSATTEALMPIGHKLAVWVSVEQVAGSSEKVTGSLTAPAKQKPKGSVLSSADRTGVIFSACQG